MGLVRTVLCTVLLFATATAQEVVVPVGTAQTRHAAKAMGDTLGLPFFDDFTGYTGAPNAALWEAGGATVSDGFAPMPPTVGTMTLDAYDGDGMLYEQATTSLFAADTALSRPIRLDTLTTGDAVVLSFFYLPSGGSGNLWERVGDTPDADDSLLLDFYAPGDTAWHTVWGRGGVSVDTLLAQTGRAWQYVAVAIDEARYFGPDFRFRFRNYCSIEYDSKAGRTVGGDQWHVDYVLMDRGRSVTDGGVFRDIAFGAPAPSLLKHYRAMPARQFTTDEQVEQMEMKIVNRYSSELASHYGYDIMDCLGDTAYSYDGGFQNAPTGGYQTAPLHATPTLGCTLDPAKAPYTVVHTVREGAAGDDHAENDTVRYVQELDNYYAYDDGSAENGYGLTSTASRMYLTYRFDLNVEDTLTAVDIFFNHTYQQQNEVVQFYVTLWEAGDNGRPERVLYRDEQTRHPITGGYHRYVLEHAVVVPQGSLFVGLEQVGNTFINIGFDRSRNTADRIWYLTSTEWQHSILSGSLMLRPYFGSRATQAGIGTMDTGIRNLTLWPNPASTTVSIDGLTAEARVEVFDIRGVRMMVDACTGQLDVSHLTAGIYLVRVADGNGVRIGSLVVRH